MEYNGIDHEIYRQAQVLAKQFDERFEAAVPAPQHMGVRKFVHGNEWVGREIVVYWDGDHKWFKARVMAYLGETGDKGHQYRIQYPDDEETENLTLPDVNVAFVDLDPDMHPHLDPLPRWRASEDDSPGDVSSASAAPRPAMAAGASVPATSAPIAVAADRPVRERQAPAKLQVGVGEGRGRSSMGGFGEGMGEAKRGKEGGGSKGGAVGDAGGSGFIGDDGMPCTMVRSACARACRASDKAVKVTHVVMGGGRYATAGCCCGAGSRRAKGSRDWRGRGRSRGASGSTGRCGSGGARMGCALSTAPTRGGIW